MKKICILLYLLCIAYTIQAQNKLLSRPVEQPAAILKNITSLLYYKQDHLRFANDFKTYNTDGSIITKRIFLDKVATGNYLPVVLNIKDASYQLYKLPKSASEDIHDVIAQIGKAYLDGYKREGTRLPVYNLVDLNGNRYTPQNTKGKILVLKCWFLACQACREEIPALNTMVRQYKDRKDILFVSMVFDKPKEVKAFLKNTPLDYAVVTNKKDYMLNKLNIGTYPTHFIINKKGYIAKMVGDADELIAALRKEAVKK